MNLLHLPRITLESQLREIGSNPEDWISLCDQCIHLTNKARKLYEEIKKIERQVLDRITSAPTHDVKEVLQGARLGTSIKFQKMIRSILKQS